MSSKEESFKVNDRRGQSEEKSEEKADPQTTEKHSFQAETRQLLELMIHSLYSNREIFLRELISNASDALDRYRLEALTNDKLIQRDDLEIRIEADEERKTLTIYDNGIGMSRQELIDNIGTIARSGTRELLDQLAKSGESKENANLIGQFGVGFYSSFMVATRVDLVTKRAGEDNATRWSSAGDGEYTLVSAQKDEHGTTITLHLRDEEDDDLPDFTNEWQISQVVKRYSDFVSYPIKLKSIETIKDEEDDSKSEEKVIWRQLNSMKAIWMRNASEVKDEEYNEFYKHITHDWQDPLERISLKAEGRIEYQALLFIPSQAPFDMYYQQNEGGLELYLRNVKIMDKCEELIPRYLRFVKGVVDSPDLPLNVSRELLQHNRQLSVIQKGIVKKVLSTLKDDLLKKRRDDYLGFWNNFGRALKEGVVSDRDNKDRITPLLLFKSSAGDDLTTLAEYIERMKDDQEEIYYLTGESVAIVEASPHLEAAKDAGYEVLYLIDPIDELLVDHIGEIEGKKLRSLVKGDVELGNSEERKAKEEKRKEQQEGYQAILDVLAKRLEDHVKEVRLSNRLKSSLVCLVTEEGEQSPHLQKLLKQAQNPYVAKDAKRIMELNPDHPLLPQLKERYEKNDSDAIFDDYAQLLLGQALIAEGSELVEPAHFSRLVADLMVKAV